MEAEYSALSAATRVVLPLIDITKMAVNIIKSPDDFKTVVHCGCIIFEDNNGAYTLATTQHTTARTKYFNVKWHFFWQHVRNGTLVIERIATIDQLADYLTKGCVREILERIRQKVQGW